MFFVKNIIDLEREATRKTKFNAEKNLNIITGVCHWTSTISFVFENSNKIIIFVTVLMRVIFLQSVIFFFFSP